MKTSLIQRSDYKEVARFIAELNQDSAHHIGECSTNESELMQMLEEEIIDPSPEQCFVKLVDTQNRMIGLLGMDADRAAGKGYLWGPFIQKDYGVNELQILWQAFTSQLPKEIEELHLFYNTKNQLVDRFVHDVWDKAADSEHVILGLDKETFFQQEKQASQGNNTGHAISHRIIDFDNKYKEAVIQLHDQSFPNTYLPGQEMLEGLHQHHTCYLYVKDDTPLGYVYVEAEPEYGTGSVEYIAVHPNQRGQGIGKQLLIHALRHLFKYPKITRLRLTVNASQQATIKLYEGVGFSLVHRMKAVSKEL